MGLQRGTTKHDILQLIICLLTKMLIYIFLFAAVSPWQEQCLAYVRHSNINQELSILKIYSYFRAGKDEESI